jgi:nicotinamide mononucleotide adenylyltransferase
MGQEWGKIVHVKSSLQPKSEQYALFVGRWQPLHDGHKALFQQALNEGKRVWIAIRDIAPDERNPWSAEEVLNNIANEYKDLCGAGRVRVSIIPDICSIEFGRGVGYDIIEHIPPAQVGEISATKIREEMKHGK